jgi:hypothetical protein
VKPGVRLTDGQDTFGTVFSIIDFMHLNGREDEYAA